MESSASCQETPSHLPQEEPRDDSYMNTVCQFSLSVKVTTVSTFLFSATDSPWCCSWLMKLPEKMHYCPPPPQPMYGALFPDSPQEGSLWGGRVALGFRVKWAQLSLFHILSFGHSGAVIGIFPWNFLQLLALPALHIRAQNQFKKPDRAQIPNFSILTHLHLMPCTKNIETKPTLFPSDSALV